MLLSFEDKREVFRRKWHGRTPAEQGFDFIDLAQLKRKNANLHEYHLYKSQDEFDTVESDTIISALENVDKSQLLKIIHANCRMHNFIAEEALEKVPDSDRLHYTSTVTDTPMHGAQETASMESEVHNDIPQAAAEAVEAPAQTTITEENAAKESEATTEETPKETAQAAESEEKTASEPAGAE